MCLKAKENRSRCQKTQVQGQQVVLPYTPCMLVSGGWEKIEEEDTVGCYTCHTSQRCWFYPIRPDFRDTAKATSQGSPSTDDDGLFRIPCTSKRSTGRGRCALGTPHTFNKQKSHSACGAWWLKQSKPGCAHRHQTHPSTRTTSRHEGETVLQPR